MQISYCNSAEEIRRLMASRAEFQKAFDNAAAEDAFWKANFSDEPARVSGWGHNFVCPSCASQMKMEYVYHAGGEYVCPNCGEKASGRLYDEAWVYTYRYDSARALLSSALVYRVKGDPTSLEYITRYVDFYARHYDAFPVHGDYAGKGKVMGQSLDEAVWALAVLRALQVCGRETFSRDKREGWMESLFRPLAALIQSQATQIHNIPLWLQAAAGVIAIFFEDDALLESALEGEFGVRNQAHQGYTSDGFWYECSMLYHFYATEALTEFLCVYHAKAPTDELFELLHKAYQTPALLSADGWMLPAFNDGWYPLDIARNSRQLIYAHRILPTQATGAQLRRILERTPEAFENAAALVYMREDIEGYEEPQRPEKCLLPGTCLAVMNRPLHALMKCGVLTTSHMHPDCLSITIPPFAEDIGTPGYGHPLTRTYYDRTLCHNTFVMDGQSQPHRPIIGRVEEIEGGVMGTAENVYDGVNACRRLIGEGNALRDVMEIRADAAHQFDWVFRSDGEASLPAGGVAATFTGADASYQRLSDIRRYPHAEEFEARFQHRGRTLIVRIAPETLRGAQVYTAHMPGNPADHPLTAILLRTTGNAVRFEARYEVDPVI